MKDANDLHVVYCAYRPWALLSIPSIQSHPKVRSLTVLKSRQEFDANQSSLVKKTTVAFFVGWSWMIPESFFNHVLCIGMHPSDLPRYRGGSPLQHQILDNLPESKASLFTITAELDSGPVWIKKPFSLTGDNMDQICQNLAEATTCAIRAFLDKYPDITATPQVANAERVLKRRTPGLSRLSPQDFQTKSALELYNFIRGLTDPYPNAYMEDPQGNKIFFSAVRFEKAPEPPSS